MRNSLAFLACACLLAACNSSSPDQNETDTALRSLIEGHGLTGDPATGHDLPSIEDPVAVLGRKLFFSKKPEVGGLGKCRLRLCESPH
jgi:cytochrome c peroxidase